MYTGNTITEEKVASKLPKPQGYKILIGVPEVSDKTEGGVFMPDGLRSAEETASIIGFVMSLGPDCYADKDKFPNGPFCKEGDFVIFRSYSGTRFKIHGKEFRLINDDTVEAVVDDPRGYARV
jgi:co-chaperonin GroES (HSP10)|uniref:Co-chaperonin GroES n=1 Tax=uncultured virus TaxID=340016 RepID=A0A221S373_9VIRU|nr:co-chaperonin GroES [uncultured virus]